MLFWHAYFCTQNQTIIELWDLLRGRKHYSLVWKQFTIRENFQFSVVLQRLTPMSVGHSATIFRNFTIRQLTNPQKVHSATLPLGKTIRQKIFRNWVIGNKYSAIEYFATKKKKISKCLFRNSQLPNDNFPNSRFATSNLRNGQIA